MKNKVVVLMSTYNGEKYIREQIESLLSQDKVELVLNIRDDGSTDKTWAILKEYHQKHSNIYISKGNNLGYAMSFWRLMQDAEDADYYSFCDQDDYWCECKLYKAIQLLEKEGEEIPLLYTSRVVSVDGSESVLSKNCFNTSGTINVYESMQKSIIPGCVFVFNRMARNIAKKYNGCIESHDWAIYAITSIFGKVLYDDNSYIRYRIHQNNTVGKTSRLNEIIIKTKRLFKKSPCFRSRFAKDIMQCYKNEISQEIYQDIEILANYKENFFSKIRLLINRKYKGFIFKVLVFLGRV